MAEPFTKEQLQDVQIAAFEVLTEYSDTTFLMDDPNDIHGIAARIAARVGGTDTNA